MSCDLHMEHINRECKNAIGALGSNILDEAVGSGGRGIGELLKVTTQCDQHNGVPPVSERHSKRAADMDLERLLKQIHEESCFQTVKRPTTRALQEVQDNLNLTRKVSHGKLTVQN